LCVCCVCVVCVLCVCCVCSRVWNGYLQYVIDYYFH